MININNECLLNLCHPSWSWNDVWCWAGRAGSQYLVNSSSIFHQFSATLDTFLVTCKQIPPSCWWSQWRRCWAPPGMWRGLHGVSQSCLHLSSGCFEEWDEPHQDIFWSVSSSKPGLPPWSHPSQWGTTGWRSFWCPPPCCSLACTPARIHRRWAPLD